MYLSRIALNTNRKDTMAALASPQKLHAAVESSFPPSYEKTNRNLWRIDRLNNNIYLLVLSAKKPDFLHIIDQFGWPGAEQKWEAKDYTTLLGQIKEGQTWQFRLRANPVHCVIKNDDTQKQEEKQRGKIYAHVTVEQQSKWLLDRGERYGFKLNIDSFRVVQRDIKRFKRNNVFITLSIVTYEGILEVTDAALLRSTLTNGVGRAKAYGCGLLTIGKGLA